LDAALEKLSSIFFSCGLAGQPAPPRASPRGLRANAGRANAG